MAGQNGVSELGGAAARIDQQEACPGVNAPGNQSTPSINRDPQQGQVE